jgi:hypothetical protein
MSTVQAELYPIEIFDAAVARPDTATGAVTALDIEPLPSWPLPSSPQHMTFPVDNSAQLELLPAVTPVTVGLDMPVTVDGVIMAVPEVWPLPSCPYTLLPTHWTLPVFNKAHTCICPAANAVTVPAHPPITLG